MLVNKDKYKVMLLIVFMGVGKILLGFLFSLVELIEN